MNKFEKLSGRLAKEILIDEHEVIFNLVEPEESITFTTYGDCCSDSWIEHFDTPVTPCLIHSFKEVDIPPSFDPKPTEKDHNEEEMKYYFYEIKTDRGDFLIEMRNSSNGYYGGYLE